MRCYFAPMEGLTDPIYRRLHHQYFPGIDRYYTPFLSPTVHRALTAKEQKEIPPAHTLPYRVVPQLLTKNAEDFLWMADQCALLGYEEVNLNLGCPSGTVTAKGKGSGMLKDPDGLDRFLNDIYRSAPVKISVKTRLGFQDPQEFPKLLDIFNQYPICELTVHPRVRDAFYKGPVHMELFTYCYENAKMPLCYNGDIWDTQQLAALAEKFPKAESCMIGRGLIGDPGMVTGGTSVQALEGFCNALLEAYTQAFGSARNAMFRMKENWRYLSCRFENCDKLYKKLRKTTDVEEYRDITREIFATLPLRPRLMPDW